MKIWMKVTDDEYELPMAVAETIDELANMICRHPGTILTDRSRRKKKGRRQIYQFIEIPDEG